MVVTAIAAVLVVVGLAGIVVPVLPGLLLVWGGVALWAVARHDLTSWVVLGIATALVAAGTAAKYLLPGRRLRANQVPWTTLGLGVAVAVAGFFLIPVVGVVLGFVLGVYLAERVRLGGHEQAWPSTRQALAAVGWSIVIELVTGLLVVATWVVGLTTG
jgi:uncharacterized protein